MSDGMTPQELDPQFQAERDAEYDRFRKAQRPVKISRWNPRLTEAWDERSRAAAREHIREWSRQWWADRGFRMVVTDEANDEITVEKAD